VKEVAEGYAGSVHNIHGLGSPMDNCQVRRNGISMAEYDHVCAFLGNFPKFSILQQDRTAVEEVG